VLVNRGAGLPPPGGGRGEGEVNITPNVENVERAPQSKEREGSERSVRLRHFCSPPWLIFTTKSPPSQEEKEGNGKKEKTSPTSSYLKNERWWGVRVVVACFDFTFNVVLPQLRRGACAERHSVPARKCTLGGGTGRAALLYEIVQYWYRPNRPLFHRINTTAVRGGWPSSLSHNAKMCQVERGAEPSARRPHRAPPQSNAPRGAPLGFGSHKQINMRRTSQFRTPSIPFNQPNPRRGFDNTHSSTFVKSESL